MLNVNLYIPDYQRDYFDFVINQYVLKKGFQYYIYMENEEIGELNASLRWHPKPMFIIKPKKNAKNNKIIFAPFKNH